MREADTGMEELLAYLFLRLVGIVTEEEYQDRLDAAFLADEGNEILLEMELNGDMGCTPLGSQR